MKEPDKTYDRFAVIHDKKANKDTLLLFYHNMLVRSFDLKPAINELLYVKGWKKDEG